jgi:hypothetical protein
MIADSALARRTVSTPTLLLSQLPTEWRARAVELRRWAAAEGAASALECAANELEECLAQEADQLLNVAQAAAQTGRHRDTIGTAIRTGRLTNRGEKHRPLVRRAELVRAFPPSSVAGDAKPSYDPLADARSILGTRRGGK